MGSVISELVFMRVVLNGNGGSRATVNRPLPGAMPPNSSKVVVFPGRRRVRDELARPTTHEYGVAVVS